MKEVFEFSAEEVMNILSQEIFKRNKTAKGSYNVIMTANCSFGKINNIQITIGEPIPPPPKDRYL